MNKLNRKLIAAQARLALRIVRKIVPVDKTVYSTTERALIYSENYGGGCPAVAKDVVNHMRLRDQAKLGRVLTRMAVRVGHRRIDGWAYMYKRVIVAHSIKRKLNYAY